MVTQVVIGTKYGELRFYDLRASRRPQCEVKGISGDKGGHQECDRGISALCLTREPFPGVCRADVGGDISCVDARTRRMCKRLAGPAGAVWSLNVCPVAGEWEHRDKSADTHCTCSAIEDFNVNVRNAVLWGVLDGAGRAKYPHLHILPFYNLTRPRYRWHFGNCTQRPNGWNYYTCCDVRRRRPRAQPPSHI